MKYLSQELEARDRTIARLHKAINEARQALELQRRPARDELPALRLSDWS